MKIRAFLVALCLFINGYSYSQQEEKIDELVKKGIALHDAQQYDEAIEVYKEALKLDEDSPLINYEIAYSLVEKKQYKKSLKYLDKCLKKDSPYILHAYSLKGSVLDEMKKPEQAIKVYKAAIKKFPESYLLHYNLGLTYFREEQYGKAEKQLIEALRDNPIHANSAYLLGIVEATNGYRIKSLIAFNFFLIIEPLSERSKKAISIMETMYAHGINKDESDKININIDPINLDKKDRFDMMDMTLSLGVATHYVDSDKDPSILFYENTKLFLEMATEEAKDDNEEIWDFYMRIYKDLVETDNVEAYSYFISQSRGEEVIQWLENNPEKFEKLILFLEGPDEAEVETTIKEEKEKKIEKGNKE